jgi:farnesyl diphosphate synthase
MDMQHYIASKQQQIEGFLDSILPKQNNELHMAMRYSSLGGGKRFRPLLVYTTGEAFGADEQTLNYVAAAVELTHCYSLIHDDLPCMDDDAMRRGRPSCHKAFNEATAVLAGDALLTLAFEILTHENLKLDDAIKLRLIKHLSKASGAQGMVLGQALDLFPDDVTNLDSLANIHVHKTGALMQASVIMGALAAGVTDNNLIKHLEAFAGDLGLAFQIQDDILDLTHTAAHVKEFAGDHAPEESKDNCSFSVLLGTDGAEAEANRYFQSAFKVLDTLQLQNSHLAALTHTIQERKH